MLLLLFSLALPLEGNNLHFYWVEECLEADKSEPEAEKENRLMAENGRFQFNFTVLVEGGVHLERKTKFGYSRNADGN